jgi:hypothetical protein
MRRREFITLLGGAAVSWPLAARGQQQAMPVIGYLHSASPGPYSSMIAAFQHGLAEAGYVDGQNVTIDYRWAEGQFNRLPALAAELVAGRPAVLVAGGGDVSAVAAKAATTAAARRRGSVAVRGDGAAGQAHAARGRAHVMNSRRLIIQSPRRRGRAAWAAFRGRVPWRS